MTMRCGSIRPKVSHIILAGIMVGLSCLGARLFAESLAVSIDGPKQWHTNYQEARAESQRLGLPMVVHFSTTWCGPCQQMERETFSSAEVHQKLGSRFIGLKIDAEEEAELAAKFGVNAYPTDVIVAPSGQIMWRHVGYLDRGSYVGQMKNWEHRFDRERAAAIAAIKAEQERLLAMERKKNSNNQTPPMPMPVPPIVEQPQVLIGLNGYSPVRIKNNREWMKGRAEYAVTYQGVVFYLADENEQRLFNSSPERYAPRLLGCDPVELAASDRAVPGLIEIGAFYDGELYLFSSVESRNQFRMSPDRFTKTRHVLHADDIGGKRFQ